MAERTKATVLKTGFVIGGSPDPALKRNGTG